MSVTISNLTKRRRPGGDWGKLKDLVLGSKYTLSLVFAGDKLMGELNKKYRKKNKIANVLSFPLSKSEGEIFINLNKEYNKQMVTKLLIHSLLHLKGYSHSVKMESEEQKILNTYEKKHNNRS